MSSSRTNTELLGSAPVGKLLLKYSIPAVIAMTSSSLYHIIDSIFIGHGVGAMALSGVGTTLPLMSIAAAFGSMVGVGASSLISIRLGQGNRERAFLILGNAVLMNIVFGLGFALLAGAFLDPILSILGASEHTMPYAKEFMTIILCGNVFTHIYLSLNEVLRASGYPTKSMIVMLTAVGVNLGLNPLFIFVFKWGVAGSAIATVIAQFVAVVIEVVHFTNKKHFIYFKRQSFRFVGRVIRKMLSIGLAPFLLNLCGSVVVIFIISALRSTAGEDGDIAVGAYTIINRVLLFFVLLIAGLNQGMQPVVGYNFGARQFDRVLGALRRTIITATVISTTGWLISRFFPDAVAHLFVSTEHDTENAVKLIAATEQGLRTAMVIYPIIGFQVVASNFFQYIGKSSKAIFLSMTRQMLFLVPLLLTLPHIFGTHGVWISIPIADGISVCVTASLLIYQVYQLRRHPDKVKVI